jgi:recombination protein RecA
VGLDTLKKQILNKAKGVHVSRLSESTIASSSTYFRTPSYDLNRVLSGSLFKGVPSKSFTLLVGPEASFKSSFMCLCLANAQKNGYTPVIIDTEGSWTKEFVTRWGLDPENILYVYTPWVDEIMVALGQIINGEKGVKEEKLALAIDSIGGIEALKLIDDAADGAVKADQGTLQKKIKRMLKMLVNICKAQDSVCFASGHYYGNPSGYGDAEQIGGGKYAKLAPDIIIALKKSKKMSGDGPKRDQVVIGTEIKAITMKNRFFPPFHEAIIDIDYRTGINEKAGMVDLALNAGIIQQAGSWFTDTLTGEKFQGSHNAVHCITDEVLVKLDEWVKKTGYSTVNENIKEAQELLEKNVVREGEGDG